MIYQPVWRNARLFFFFFKKLGRFVALVNLFSPLVSMIMRDPVGTRSNTVLCARPGTISRFFDRFSGQNNGATLLCAAENLGQCDIKTVLLVLFFFLSFLLFLILNFPIFRFLFFCFFFEKNSFKLYTFQAFLSLIRAVIGIRFVLFIPFPGNFFFNFFNCSVVLATLFQSKIHGKSEICIGSHTYWNTNLWDNGTLVIDHPIWCI